MVMIKETKEGERVSSDAFPLYSWSEGLLYFRIERNFFNGRREVICKVWKWKDGDKMVMAMTKALHDNKMKWENIANVLAVPQKRIAENVPMLVAASLEVAHRSFAFSLYLG